MMDRGWIADELVREAGAAGKQGCCRASSTVLHLLKVNTTNIYGDNAPLA